MCGLRSYKKGCGRSEKRWWRSDGDFLSVLLISRLYGITFIITLDWYVNVFIYAIFSVPSRLDRQNAIESSSKSSKKEIPPATSKAAVSNGAVQAPVQNGAKRNSRRITEMDKRSRLHQSKWVWQLFSVFHFFAKQHCISLHAWQKSKGFTPWSRKNDFVCS